MQQLTPDQLAAKFQCEIMVQTVTDKWATSPGGIGWIRHTVGKLSASDDRTLIATGELLMLALHYIAERAEELGTLEISGDPPCVSD